MILPMKHLSLDESLLGFGAYLLGHIAEKNNIDALWHIYLADYKSNVYTVKFSFDQFILTIDYLYTIGAVDIRENGDVFYAINKTDG